MNDYLLDMALRHFDFEDHDIARIKAAIPKIAYVAYLLKHNKTVINELTEVFELVAAQVAKKEQE